MLIWLYEVYNKHGKKTEDSERRLKGKKDEYTRRPTPRKKLGSNWINFRENVKAKLSTTILSPLKELLEFLEPLNPLSIRIFSLYIH